MENKTIFESFDLDGISYYYFKGKYYVDNMTIREVISEKEYKDALMSKLIKGAQAPFYFNASQPTSQGQAIVMLSPKLFLPPDKGYTQVQKEFNNKKQWKGY